MSRSLKRNEANKILPCQVILLVSLVNHIWGIHTHHNWYQVQMVCWIWSNVSTVRTLTTWRKIVLALKQWEAAKKTGNNNAAGQLTSNTNWPIWNIYGPVQKRVSEWTSYFPNYEAELMQNINNALNIRPSKNRSNTTNCCKVSQVVH